MVQVAGACVCKAVRVTVEDQPDKVVICYCSDCRKMSGHLGQIIAIFPANKVRIEDKRQKLKPYSITNTASGKPNNINFCSDCGCTINSMPMVYDGKLNLVRTTVLDDGYERFVPTEEIFTKDKCAFSGQIAKL